MMPRGRRGGQRQAAVRRLLIDFRGLARTWNALLMATVRARGQIARTFSLFERKLHSRRGLGLSTAPTRPRPTSVHAHPPLRLLKPYIRAWKGLQGFGSEPLKHRLARHRRTETNSIGMDRCPCFFVPHNGLQQHQSCARVAQATTSSATHPAARCSLSNFPPQRHVRPPPSPLHRAPGDSAKPMAPRTARLQCPALALSVAGQIECAPPFAQATALSSPLFNYDASAEIPRFTFEPASGTPSPIASTTSDTFGQLFSRFSYVWTTRPISSSSTQSPTPTPTTASAPTAYSDGDTEAPVSTLPVSTSVPTPTGSDQYPVSNPTTPPPAEATGDPGSGDSYSSGSRDAPVLPMPTGPLTDPPHPLAKEATTTPTSTAYESTGSSSVAPTATTTTVIADVDTAHAAISLDQESASNGDAGIPVQVSMQAKAPSTGAISPLNAFLLPIAAAAAAAVAIGVVAFKMRQRRRHFAHPDLETPPMSSLVPV